MKYVFLRIHVFTINVCVLLENILEKITQPSKLLEIQQNLSDDQAKAKLRVERYVFKMNKMSSLRIE